VADSTNELATLEMIRALVADPARRRAVEADPSAAAADLGLPPQAASQLLAIVRISANGHPPTSAPAPAPAPPVVPSGLLLEPFRQIRLTFWLVTAMSVIAFLAGLVALYVALRQALDEESISTSTLAIAGFGLAVLALLFFRHPWQDIGDTLADAQQARIVSSSYLAGLELLRNDPQTTTEDINALTRASVELLEGGPDYGQAHY
jgi:hypothetical protein